jgi:hypothetical protein
VARWYATVGNLIDLLEAHRSDVAVVFELGEPIHQGVELKPHEIDGYMMELTHEGRVLPASPINCKALVITIHPFGW